MNRRNSLAYGVLGLPLAFAALPIYVHIPRYYAEIAGLELTLLGAILLGARLLDAAIDPWFGWLADRIPRPQMVAIALMPFVLGFVALLNPPTNHAAPWLLGSLALTYLGFSAASIAYQAWGADVGDNSTARTQLTAAREGCALVGVLLAAALPSVLANGLNQGIERLSWVLPPIVLLAASITFSCIERGAAQPTTRIHLRDSLKSVLADPIYRRLLWVFIANGISSALPATLFLFFVADVLQNESASGPLLALYFVAGAASLPIWVHLAKQYGRVRTWGLAMLLAMIAFAGTSLLGPGDLLPFALICLASGLALGADLALPSAIVADLGERQNQAGSYFGIWNFVAKLNLALAAGLALPLLGQLGYQPGGEQGLVSLTVVYALLPLGFKLLAACLLWHWRDSLEIRS